ncbi:MAG TPA: hypothetical protein VMW53_10330 [archaeon]|nr:hypothetical protein [archaeon]
MSNSPGINSGWDKSGTNALELLSKGEGIDIEGDAEVSFKVSFIDDCEMFDVLEFVFSPSIQPEIRIIPTTNKQITDNFFIHSPFSHLIA